MTAIEKQCLRNTYFESGERRTEMNWMPSKGSENLLLVSDCHN